MGNDDAAPGLVQLVDWDIELYAHGAEAAALQVGISHENAMRLTNVY